MRNVQVNYQRLDNAIKILKYTTVLEQLQKSKRKVEERGKFDTLNTHVRIHDHTFMTSIKNGRLIPPFVLS